MSVPFVDLKAQYASIKDEIDAAVAAVLTDTQFVGGAHLEAFEAAFAAYCGVEYALGVGNGTDALELALRACGIGAGDEVITAPNTFIATAEAITNVGAQVVFADVDPQTCTLDPQRVDAAITRRTRAIIPVHLYGRPADMDALLALAQERKLRVIGDAAQAHGALWKGRRIGTLGDAVCFSFYPGKNLGAYGDGGAVVTSDPDIAKRVSMLRNHGRTEKYEHACEGVNSRLDGLQAAVLAVKLRHLEDWTNRRRMVARQYHSLLASVPGIAVPAPEKDVRAVYHLYVIRTSRRDALQKRLAQAGIATGIHYPIPLHLQPAYARLELRPGRFPQAERQAQEILSLPMYAELAKEQVDLVAGTVRLAMEQLAAPQALLA
jgi:dTDP-4-amino-4,6-dideoxygalactose transaminase